MVYLLGAEANAEVFGNDDRFRAREAFRALEPVDGPTSVVLSDGADHTRRRGALRPAVAPRRVDGYVETMVQSADDALATVRVDTPVDAYALLRSAIRRSTLRSLFGGEMAEHADVLGRNLQPLLAVADHLPQRIALMQRLGTPGWRRAMSARRAVDELIVERIAAERARPPAEPAVARTGLLLPLLVHGPDGTGSGLSDQEIRDQAVTMIAAGYETTSAAMGWVVALLGAHPHWQQRASAEVAAVLGDRPPDPSDLAALPLLGAIVSEALRLYPPAMISARYVVEDFVFSGRPVRAGDLVVFSPYVTHRDASLYDQPTRFLPDRWLDGGRRPPGEYLPFGGGVHRCLGAHMATVELTVMLARLLARGSYSLTRAPSRARGYAAMRPDPGVWIALSSGRVPS